MVGVFVGLKLRLLRNSFTGTRTALTLLGSVFGLIAAATAAITIAIGVEDLTVSTEVAAAWFAVWALGWLVGPLVLGGDETLRPEHFALLPLRPRLLARGLLVAGLVGVPAAVTAIAFAGLVLRGIALGVAPTAVALVATALEFAVVILASRVLTGALAVLQGFRRLKELAIAAATLIVVSGYFLVSTVLGGVAVVVVQHSSPTLSTLLRALPTGWGPSAVEAAATSDWARAFGLLAGLAALAGILLWLWTTLLAKRLTRPASTTGAAGRARWARLLPATALGAVVSKELRLWSRDPHRRVGLIMGLATGMFLPFSLSVATSGFGQVAFAPLWMVVFGCTQVGNLYGFDGTSLWHTLATPGAIGVDVRGRQLAWMLAVTPLSMVGALALPAVTGNTDAYPWLLATVPAATGAGAGVVVLLAVRAPYPMPAKNTNPFTAHNQAGMARTLLYFVMIALLAAAVLPAAATVALGSWLHIPTLLWVGGPIGVVTGVGAAWWWGRLAIRRLTTHGPEILAIVRPVG